MFETTWAFVIYTIIIFIVGMFFGQTINILYQAILMNKLITALGADETMMGKLMKFSKVFDSPKGEGNKIPEGADLSKLVSGVTSALGFDFGQSPNKPRNRNRKRTSNLKNLGVES